MKRWSIPTAAAGPDLGVLSISSLLLFPPPPPPLTRGCPPRLSVRAHDVLRCSPPYAALSKAACSPPVQVSISIRPLDQLPLCCCSGRRVRPAGKSDRRPWPACLPACLGNAAAARPPQGLFAHPTALFSPSRHSPHIGAASAEQTSVVGGSAPAPEAETNIPARRAWHCGWLSAASARNIYRSRRGLIKENGRSGSRKGSKRRCFLSQQRLAAFGDEAAFWKSPIESRQRSRIEAHRGCYRFLGVRALI